MDFSGWGVSVLAAGKGKRMKSSYPKMLIPLLGRPILNYVLDTIGECNFGEIEVVVSPSIRDLVGEIVGNDSRLVLQSEAKGTADAVRVSLQEFPGAVQNIMVVYGDMPLLESDTLSFLGDSFQRNSCHLAFLTACAPSPTGYGRVIKDEHGLPQAIREEKDCSPQEKQIKEINLGIFAFDRKKLSQLIELVDNRNQQGEYYLTDLVALAREKGYRVEAFEVGWSEQFLNVNHPQDLATVVQALREKKVNSLWEKGAKIVDPSNLYLDWEVEIGEDVWFKPGVVVEGPSSIGNGSIIGPFVRIASTVIGENCRIELSVLEEATLEAGVTVGPFAHLRPGSYLESGVRIGNFVEVKNSTLKEGTKALHLSYLGDAQVGQRVNIGAGTITCNFDGEKKNPTIIQDGAFIGSNSSLVAPVVIGQGAYTAAGSAITKDVPPDALAIGRARQKNVEKWTKRRGKRSSKG